MKKGMYKKSNVLMRITAWVVIYAFLMLPSGVAFAGNGARHGQDPHAAQSWRFREGQEGRHPAG